MTTAQQPRETTPEERDALLQGEADLFGYTIDPCQSIPPRHAPYTASDGHTYCTRCGDDITEQP